MRYTNVKGYSDEQLLNKVKSLPNFTKIPSDYWILGVQSEEDEYNVFDDKFYVFKGEKFIMVTSGTTNPGEFGLLNYHKYGQNGTFVIKSDYWFYDLWKFGYHKGKMPALKQNKPIIGYRDSNRNKKSEEMGKPVEGFFGINFHTVDYALKAGFWRKLIGGYSTGCQVVNDVSDYIQILDLVKNQTSTTYCIINEF